MLNICRGCLHHHWAWQDTSDGSKDGDALPTELVDDELDRPLSVLPSTSTPHPCVETGLVQVDDRLLVSNQMCELQSKPISCRNKVGPIHGRRVGSRGLVVLDPLTLVEVPECRDLNADAQCFSKHGTALPQRVPTPGLKHVSIEEV